MKAIIGIIFTIQNFHYCASLELMLNEVVSKMVVKLCSYIYVYSLITYNQ